MTKLVFSAIPLLATLALFSTPVQAETLAIVAHPSLQHTLSEDDIRRIYLGKLSRLPNGSRATPLMIRQPDAAHSEFARTVLNRSPKQLNSYWAKRLFTGKSKPPVPVQNLEEMKAMVAKNKGYIGYLLLSDTDESVKTVFVAAASPS
ncbi:MAG: phosphate ABC transporter substrate-binding protein [Granulosicoccaceae bacterium]